MPSENAIRFGTSDLIGLAAGSGTLVRIGADSAACWSVSSGNGRCRRRNALRCGVALAGLVQLVTEFVLGLLEFLDCLAEAARKLWQFLRPEQDENNQQNDDQIGAAKIHETGEETHIQLQHSDPLTQLARQFGHALDRKAWLGRGVL